MRSKVKKGTEKQPKRNVEEYCKDLGNIIKFQDTVKKVKNNFDYTADLSIVCKDGHVLAHQMILGAHSKLLKQFFLSQHALEFAVVDWEAGLAQLNGRRSPDHLVTIFLPDFYREDFKRFHILFYRGEVIIENEVQSSILKELFKTLQIESVKLSDLALTEVKRKVVEEPPPPPKIAETNTVFLDDDDNFPPTPESFDVQDEILPTSKPIADVKRLIPITQDSTSPVKKKSNNPISTDPTPNKPNNFTEKTKNNVEIDPLAVGGDSSSDPLAIADDSQPQKTQVLNNRELESFDCRKCNLKIAIHGRQVMSNLMRFQMHMISHFKDYLYPDVPHMPKY
jgi:hypothetical protein